MGSSIRHKVVAALNQACVGIDAVAYRPAIVKLTSSLPRWWNCELSHVSMELDRRWGTGYWQSDDAPPAPNGPCDACGRRAAWLVVGGSWGEWGEEEDEDERVPDYLDLHSVSLCGWCWLDTSGQALDRNDLEKLLVEARKRSVSWHWRRKSVSSS